jgi:DNA-binding MltR family transcriptional regulator
MASGSRGKRSNATFSLQKLLNQARDSDESWDIIQNWQTQTGDDRSQAIVAGALLEQGLESALESHFELNEEETRALFADQEGSISSFASKIKLAYALGIIENMIRSELTLIKTIRNVFAHTRAAVTFENPEIVSACDFLKLPAIITYGGLIGEKPINAKEKFATSVKLIYLHFVGDHGNRLTGKRPLKYNTSGYYCGVFLRTLTAGERKVAAAMLANESPEASQQK